MLYDQMVTSQPTFPKCRLKRVSFYCFSASSSLHGYPAVTVLHCHPCRNGEHFCTFIIHNGCQMYKMCHCLPELNRTTICCLPYNDMIHNLILRKNNSFCFCDVSRPSYHAVKISNHNTIHNHLKVLGNISEANLTRVTSFCSYFLCRIFSSWSAGFWLKKKQNKKNPIKNSSTKFMLWDQEIKLPT